MAHPGGIRAAHGGGGRETSGRLPVVFISHGSPAVALADDDYTGALRRLGTGLRPARAIVVLSAHWESPLPLRVTAGDSPGLIYDFSGFPEPLYRITYPCPGDPDLARDILSVLSAAHIAGVPEPRRGLDHGVWVPLLHIAPGAERPVVEVSLPVPRTPADLLKIGRALAPLRDRGVLLVGSGGVVHNLARIVFEEERPPVEAWAEAFDAWFRDRLEARDVEGIVRYRTSAPRADLAVPTTEHFDPIFFALGAAAPDDRITHVYEGFRHGNLSMRSFALGA